MARLPAIDTAQFVDDCADADALVLDDPPDDEWAEWDDLRGQAQDATGSLSSEAFIRALRDEWP